MRHLSDVAQKFRSNRKMVNLAWLLLALTVAFLIVEILLRRLSRLGEISLHPDAIWQNALCVSLCVGMFYLRSFSRPVLVFSGLAIVFLYVFVAREALVVKYFSKDGPWKITDIDMFVYTSPRSASRLKRFHELEKEEGISVKEIMGIGIKILKTSRETLEGIKATPEELERYGKLPIQKVIGPVQQILQKRALQQAHDESSRPWVLWMEDDLRIEEPGTFKITLVKTLNTYETDMIWLSVLNVPLWNVAHRLCCGMQGVLFRRSAVPKILKAVAESSYLDGNLDSILASLCNEGVIKCTAVPVVGETGVASLADSLSKQSLLTMFS